MKSKLKNINSNTGKFIDGNPTSGELGTIVTAEWLNGVQERVQDTFEELKNVLALANLQPEDNKTTQVADAIRAYVQTFNLKIESNTRSLANVIPNSKKSSAVNSNSADTVATSVALKTAYDKAVDAKQAADDANGNANGRVSKSGDTMTGNLTLPHITIQDNEAFATIKSSNNSNASVDFIVQNGMHPQATVRAHDVGGYAVELQFHTTPKGSNYSTDRRQHMMTIAHDGNIWAKPYGWLHNFFAKQSDNDNIWNVLNNQVVKRDDFIRSWYPNHYNGTEVYKIKHLGLMITLMNATGDKELILPENYDGHFIVLATDRGQGRIPVNSNYGIANNRIRVGGRSDTAVSVLVIGQKSI